MGRRVEGEEAGKGGLGGVWGGRRREGSEREESKGVRVGRGKPPLLY